MQPIYAYSVFTCPHCKVVRLDKHSDGSLVCGACGEKFAEPKIVVDKK